jgi:plastocyanin
MKLRAFPLLETAVLVGALSVAPAVVLVADAREPAGGGGGAATTTDPAQAQAAVTIHIQNFAFDPATITVAPGTKVTWVNDDEDAHVVAAEDSSYRSAPLDTGDSFSHVYASPGEYPYFCTLHPHMKAVVVVRAEGR